MMMVANLVGFVLGTGGTWYLVNQLVNGWEGKRPRKDGEVSLELHCYVGAIFTLITLPCLFIAVQVMFEYR